MERKRILGSLIVGEKLENQAKLFLLLYGVALFRNLRLRNYRFLKGEIVKSFRWGRWVWGQKLFMVENGFPQCLSNMINSTECVCVCVCVCVYLLNCT